MPGTDSILASCPHFDPRKSEKGGNLIRCPYLCENLLVIMYRKLRDVPHSILNIFPPFVPISKVSELAGLQCRQLTKGSNSEMSPFLNIFPPFVPIS